MKYLKIVLRYVVGVNVRSTSAGRCSVSDLSSEGTLSKDQTVETFTQTDRLNESQMKLSAASSRPQWFGSGRTVYFICCQTLKSELSLYFC